MPGYKNDIFISYSHLDNDQVERDVQGWVDIFHKHLTMRLAKKFGEMGLIEIWRDERLEKGEYFDRTIQEALDESAIFICLTSMCHVKSEYCQKELDRFYKKASAPSDSIAVGNRSRIVNCLIQNIHHDKWPEQLAGTTGFKFYDPDEYDDATEPRSKRFNHQMHELVDYLFNLLEAFRNKKLKEQKESTASTVDKDVSTVFIADVADSLRSYRKRLISDLKEKGFRIVSNIPPPYEPTKHDENVQRALEQSVLSIHLLDEYAGREMDGFENKSYAHKQVEMAMAQKVTPYIWVPKDLQLDAIEDKSHRSFIDQLENADRRNADYDFIRGSQPQLVPEILEKINKIRSAPGNFESKNAVLLDTHQKDQLFAFELGKFLVQHNIQPFINPQEDDPNKDIDILERQLKKVSALLILYGHVTDEWVKHRLGTALKFSLVNSIPIKSFCVVNVPPPKPREKLDFRIGNIPINMFNTDQKNLNAKNFSSILHALNSRVPA